MDYGRLTAYMDTDAHHYIGILHGHWYGSIDYSQIVSYR